jgi:nucleoside-diphosphate-sugar epimerase
VILVTGGTGFVGRHLVARLLTDGFSVRVLSRGPAPSALPEGMAWAQGDLTVPASLASALRGVDTVVHAGAVLGEAGADAYERVNVAGTRAIALAAREAGVRRFVHVSSAGVYGDGDTGSPHAESDTPRPLTPYEKSKHAAEGALASALEGSRVRWTILRPQGLYGPDRPATQDFFRQVAHRSLWLHGPARVVVHPTCVEDLAWAVGRLMALDGLGREIINIGGARALEFHELVALVGRCVGRAPTQIRAPHWARMPAALLLRAWPARDAAPPLLQRWSRAWINRAVSTDKARKLLGFSPVPLERGLERTAAAMLVAGRP